MKSFSETSRDAADKAPYRFYICGPREPEEGYPSDPSRLEKIPNFAATLTIVGKLQIPQRVFARFASRVRVVPTVRRDEVARHLWNADCFLLPSYFEGSAISVYEALASGLGVIQSRNTGVNIASTVGYTLEKLNVDELMRAVMTIVDNPTLLELWRSNARNFVEQFDFETYARNVRRVAGSTSSLATC
jgi:glycosyltransferase involved in cell wall biosynthesis